MEVCVKNVIEVEKFFGYMQLFRIVFRGLVGCKFEFFFRDLIFMLLFCFNMFLIMFEGLVVEDMRDFLMEFFLMFFVCLSFLLLYFFCLMKFFVFCLRGSDEFVSLGLCILEFWVDSLNFDFLELSMVNVIFEVILVLWFYLRSVLYFWGGKVL